MMNKEQVWLEFAKAAMAGDYTIGGGSGGCQWCAKAADEMTQEWEERFPALEA